MILLMQHFQDQGKQRILNSLCGNGEFVPHPQLIKIDKLRDNL